MYSLKSCLEHVPRVLIMKPGYPWCPLVGGMVITFLPCLFAVQCNIFFLFKQSWMLCLAADLPYQCVIPSSHFMLLCTTKLLCGQFTKFKKDAFCLYSLWIYYISSIAKLIPCMKLLYWHYWEIILLHRGSVGSCGKMTYFIHLTHWGLVTPFGDIDLGQHWLR